MAGDPDRKAFEELKKYLASPPLLVRPEVGEVLYLYLATSPEAVSSVLVRENENRVHQPVYYVSKVLHEAETRYSKAEKMIFALVISAQRLRPYFQAHAIMVLTDQPRRAILHRPDKSGQLAKWAVRLGEFDIQYRPRPALKAQVLADFIAECPTTDMQSGEGDPVKVGTFDCCPDPAWVLYIDGASNAQGSGAGFLLTSPEGVVTEHALRFDFKASNNQAEYEALVAGLKLALELGIDRLQVFSDSQLIVKQTKGKFETRDPTMAKYRQKVKDLVTPFKHFEISHIPRAENARADALSRLAMSDYDALGRTFMENLGRPSIDKVDEVLQLTTESSWMDPIVRSKPGYKYSKRKTKKDKRARPRSPFRVDLLDRRRLGDYRCVHLDRCWDVCRNRIVGRQWNGGRCQIIGRGRLSIGSMILDGLSRLCDTSRRLVGHLFRGLIIGPRRDDAAEIQLWVQGLDRIPTILVPHPVRCEAGLK
ncbi:uncharacterized protein [Elaeis guineensis]|uniref:uncharacterized protein n=1 Tax=Elaeis guineensis var. tenera TaxID=51953 RepID=UPI003C6D3C5E